MDDFPQGQTAGKNVVYGVLAGRKVTAGVVHQEIWLRKTDTCSYLSCLTLPRDTFYSAVEGIFASCPGRIWITRRCTGEPSYGRTRASQAAVIKSKGAPATAG